MLVTHRPLKDSEFPYVIDSECSTISVDSRILCVFHDLKLGPSFPQSELYSATDVLRGTLFYSASLNCKTLCTLHPVYQNSEETSATRYQRLLRQ